MVKIIDTTLRDANQSLIATRMTTKEIIEVISDLDKVGFYALEVWGGATFDVCVKFLNEDPWDRLRQIKKSTKKTKLQMLLRGQNLVGYRPYSNDTLETFIIKSVENGIDIFRVFDALNDFNNLASSIKSILKTHAHCQIALAYTVSPFHNDKYYLDFAVKAQELGAHSICIKDMSGILMPDNAERLVKALKSKIKIPINIHCHDTSGIISASYLKAIESGVDFIDTAMSPFSSGNSQPPTESFIRILHKENASDFYNLSALELAREKLLSIRKKYLLNGVLNLDSYTPYPRILTTQVPGGMLSNLYSQLKEQGQESIFNQVLDEVPKVREDFGFPPLVTPISQFVGVQASLNVILNERYKVVSKEVKEFLSGNYGKIPGPLNQEVMKKIGISSFNNSPNFDFDEFKLIRKKMSDKSFSDENLLTHVIIGSSHILKPDLINEEFIEEKKYKMDIRFIETEEIFILAPYNSRIIKFNFKVKEVFNENDILVEIITVDKLKIYILAPCNGTFDESVYPQNSVVTKNTVIAKIIKPKI